MGHRSRAKKREAVSQRLSFQITYGQGVIPMSTLESLYGQRLSLHARVVVLERLICELNGIIQAQDEVIRSLQNDYYLCGR